jgi:hypothetical protein
MVAYRLSAAVAANLKVVKANGWKNLGTIGNKSHLMGSGDHTPWSTHGGRSGRPQRGIVHAHDIGMSDAHLVLLEKWLRAQWRNGAAGEVKYVNILNRHWNLQTQAGWAKAKSGQIRPTRSTDHHLHLSYEPSVALAYNGEPLLGRFAQWLKGSGSRPVQPGAGLSGRLGEVSKLPPRPSLASQLRTTDVYEVPAWNVAQVLRVVPGHGGPENRGQQELVGAVLAAVRTLAPGTWWPRVRDTSPEWIRGEFGPSSVAMLKDVTTSFGGKWNPQQPVDTLLAVGFKPGQWK